MRDDNDLVIRAGDTARGQYLLDISPKRAGWRFSGIKVLDLVAGGSQRLDTGEDEYLVLPMSGGCQVTVADVTYELTGRSSVFSSVTDYLYLPRGSEARISSAGGGRFALPHARASKRLEESYQPAGAVRTELRGAGVCSRQVNNYALHNEVQTDHLLVCEVLTPNGNWSSYPPHKHDEHTADERELEEIYLFEVAPGPAGPGFAFHRTYGTEERPIDVCTEIRSGDVVLTPHGYHGPAMAPPGYDLYYLNVMAGPAEDRQWLVTHDPAHDWVREQWAEQELDPRLPMTAQKGEEKS